MPRITDAPIPGWTPPAYKVVAEGKLEGVEPGTPNNWGRWGDDDQRGTMNLCTPDRIARAAALIRTGKRFSLGVPIGHLKSPSGRPDPLHFFTSAASDVVLGDNSFGERSQRVFGDGSKVKYNVSDDHVVLALQYTTQLDGFGFGVNDSLYNGYWAGLVTATSGARRLGMHNRAAGYVGRGVLLDVARHLGVDRLEPEYRITPDLLEETARAQGVDEPGAGDTLLVRTGFLDWYFQADPAAREAHDGPGLHSSVVPWLAERDVAMVAVDYLSIEVTSSWEDGSLPLPFHVGALRDLGMGVGETFDLGELAADCAEDSVWEFFTVVNPLPVAGGCGSPLNPIVIK